MSSSAMVNPLISNRDNNEITNCVSTPDSTFKLSIFVSISSGVAPFTIASPASAATTVAALAISIAFSNSRALFPSRPLDSLSAHTPSNPRASSPNSSYRARSHVPSRSPARRARHCSAHRADVSGVPRLDFRTHALARSNASTVFASFRLSSSRNAAPHAARATRARAPRRSG